jgi:hypothetical protein
MSIDKTKHAAQVWRKNGERYQFLIEIKKASPFLERLFNKIKLLLIVDC